MVPKHPLQIQAPFTKMSDNIISRSCVQKLKVPDYGYPEIRQPYGLELEWHTWAMQVVLFARSINAQDILDGTKEVHSDSGYPYKLDTQLCQVIFGTITVPEIRLAPTPNMNAHEMFVTVEKMVKNRLDGTYFKKDEDKPEVKPNEEGEPTAEDQSNEEIQDPEVPDHTEGDETAVIIDDGETE